MKVTFKQFLSFLKTGKTESNSMFLPREFKNLGKLYLMHEMLALTAALIAATIAQQINLPRNSTLDWINSLSVPWVFLIPNIIGPAFEEFTYRLWLKASKFTISISVLFVVYLFTNKILGSTVYSFEGTFVLEVAISIGAATLTAFFLSFQGVLEKVQKFWSKNLRILVVISIIWFGLAHVGNFPLENWQYFYSSIIVLPQLVMGAVLAFGRLRYGILCSIIIHILHNTIW